MMNIQNPALYPPQQAYTGFGNAMAQPPLQPPSYPSDFPQNQFQQSFPQTPQRPNQFPQQPGSKIPPHVYQQLQQQQGFVRPQSRGSNGMIPGQQQTQSPQNNSSTNHGQTPNQAPRTNAPPTPASATQISKNMAMAAQMQQMMPGSVMAQQVQMQNPTQQMKGSVASQQQQQQQQQPSSQVQHQPPNTPLSPQSATREKARVAILLEINSLLLREVISLQSQGKAGPVTQQTNNPNQQSPTSPTSTTAENASSFSPTDSAPQIKAAGPPSKEYQECMRRLQANLSYLAAIADAKKRPDGKIPQHPQIISPPMHLKEAHDLYKKLAMLFPEAGQSKASQAIAFASAQQQQNNPGGMHHTGLHSMAINAGGGGVNPALGNGND